MKRMYLLLLCLGLVMPPVFAGEASPVGLWRSYDDAGVKEKAWIRITEKNGVLQGRIEKLILTPTEDQNPVCIKCSGQRKDQPLIGMVILNDLKNDGGEYTGGEIFDPEVGKAYKCKIRVVEGGKKMQVRGYIGMPMLGRSQVWQRQE